MGTKSAWERQYLLFCVAGLLTLLWGCSLALNQWKTEEHLARARYLLSRGEFDASLAESRKTLQMYPRSLGDQALFQIGLIYAHPDNPEHDYRKAIANFEQLVRAYPGSRRKLEAETWIQALKELAEAERQLKEQVRTLQALSQKLRKQRESAKNLQEEYRSAMDARESKIKALQKKIDALQGSIDQLKEVDIKIEEKRRETSP